MQSHTTAVPPTEKERWRWRNWCPALWLYIWLLETVLLLSLGGVGSLGSVTNTVLSYCGKVAYLSRFSILYFGTCAIESCQSGSACFPASALDERPSRRSQWQLALDCPWLNKQHCLSFAPVSLGRPTLSTPSRTEDYYVIMYQCFWIQLRQRDRQTDYSNIAPVSHQVWESWLGGPADMLRPGCLAENWIGLQPPYLNYYKSPASLCFLGTYSPCIYINTQRWICKYEGKGWYKQSNWSPSVTLLLTCLWFCHRVTVQTQSIQVWSHNSSGSLPAFAAPSYCWEKESWKNHMKNLSPTKTNHPSILYRLISTRSQSHLWTI